MGVTGGSADARPGDEGLAHFHEHMLFKGTERRGVGDIAGDVEGAGGRINAYTSFDTTVYYATLPSEALGTGVDVLSDAELIFDADALKRIVWEREQQRSTGIGQGLAIPHGKADCAESLVMAIGCPASPIDFDSVDKQPVRLIVLLASPPDKTSQHIQALGKISRLLSDASFRDAATTAESAEALYALFEEAERATPAEP